MLELESLESFTTRPVVKIDWLIIDLAGPLSVR